MVHMTHQRLVCCCCFVAPAARWNEQHTACPLPGKAAACCGGSAPCSAPFPVNCFVERCSSLLGITNSHQFHRLFFGPGRAWTHRSMLMKPATMPT
jgi:hypothetical protein